MSDSEGESSGMSAENQVVRPPPKFHSLEEASQILNIQKGDLLKHGAEGRIRLFVTVPEGICLINIDTDSLGISKFYKNNMDVVTLNKLLEGGDVKYSLENLNYLTLDAKICVEIFESLGTAKCAHIFESGFLSCFSSRKLTQQSALLIHGDGRRNEYHKLPQKIISKSVHKYFSCSAKNILVSCQMFRPSYSKKMVVCKGIELTTDSIYVLGSELNKIESDVIIERDLKGVKVSFANKVYTSKKLARLTHAARKYWQGTNFDVHAKEYKNPPDDTEVKKFLRANELFDETLATVACGIIRPKYATRTASSEEKKDKSDYITKELIGLWHASSEFWRRFDPANVSTHVGHTNEVVAEWLVKEYGLSEKRAKAGASIIRPDAVKGRPKRKA